MHVTVRCACMSGRFSPCAGRKRASGEPERARVTVLERPVLREVLRRASRLGELVLFTAGLEGAMGCERVQLGSFRLQLSWEPERASSFPLRLVPPPLVPPPSFLPPRSFPLVPSRRPFPLVPSPSFLPVVPSPSFLPPRSFPLPSFLPSRSAFLISPRFPLLQAEEQGVSVLQAEEQGVSALQAEEQGVSALQAEEQGVSALQAEDQGVSALQAEEQGVSALIPSPRPFLLSSSPPSSRCKQCNAAAAAAAAAARLGANAGGHGALQWHQGTATW
ncbi:unnamed protein product [Closterium sp. Naga37s-1]|nr:unnamed protein product [Closterium sp. Naga37s-1]